MYLEFGVPDEWVIVMLGPAPITTLSLGRTVVYIVLLTFLVTWGNQLSQLFSDFVKNQLGVDPANVFEQYKAVLIPKKSPSGHSGIIERFQEDSSYSQVNASAEILMRGDDPHQLIADFKANAQHTLEFMASNLAAKAQKVIWEQFPNNRPSEVMAAISERCHQAVAFEQSISEGLALGQHPKIGQANRI
jgi:hypothetical protein